MKIVLYSKLNREINKSRSVCKIKLQVNYEPEKSEKEEKEKSLKLISVRIASWSTISEAEMDK